MSIVEIFDQLTATASANDRKEIIKQVLNSDKRDLLIQIFEDCYGPNKYNIKSNRVVNESNTSDSLSRLTIDYNYATFHDLLIKLTNREVTGNEALEMTATILTLFDSTDQKYLRMILDKNLKIGFSLEQLNKLLDKKKKDFEVSLAYNLDDVKGVDPTDGTFYASRKLDGTRCICIVETAWKDNQAVVIREPIFISRQNKVFTTLDKLKEPIKKLALGYHYVGRIVFDGEVCIMDDKGNEHFDWIMKEIRRKDHTIENPCYNIFDVLSGDEFEGLTESEPFSTRNFYLLNAFYHLNETYGKQPELKLLKQELIQSQEDFDRWSQYVTDGGWEGFMLRKDVPYRSGRTKDLLKVKKFKDAEYKVVGYESGMIKYGTNEVPVVTNILIEHKGNTVSVGSGLSKEQRIAWYSDPSKIVGKMVTIQYFEETQDKKTGNFSLRFPVLKYVYETERDI